MPIAAPEDGPAAGGAAAAGEVGGGLGSPKNRVAHGAVLDCDRMCL
jgi:hypothetical protein